MNYGKEESLFGHMPRRVVLVVIGPYMYRYSGQIKPVLELQVRGVRLFFSVALFLPPLLPLREVL